MIPAGFVTEIDGRFVLRPIEQPDAEEAYRQRLDEEKRQASLVIGDKPARNRVAAYQQSCVEKLEECLIKLDKAIQDRKENDPENNGVMTLVFDALSFDRQFHMSWSDNNASRYYLLIALLVPCRQWAGDRILKLPDDAARLEYLKRMAADLKRICRAMCKKNPDESDILGLLDEHTGRHEPPSTGHS